MPVLRQNRVLIGPGNPGGRSTREPRAISKGPPFVCPKEIHRITIYLDFSQTLHERPPYRSIVRNPCFILGR
jgi:hypothetical protein